MSEADKILSQIQATLTTWTTQWRRQRGLHWGPRGFIFGWGLGLIQAAPTLLESKLIWGEFLWILASNSLVFMFLFFGASYTWPIGTIQAARFFDRKLKLFDRLSTAVELAFDRIDGSQTFRNRQWEDTRAHTASTNIKVEFPLRLPRKELVIATLLVLSLLPIRNFTAENFRKAEVHHKISKAIAEESLTLSELLTEIENSTALDPDAQSAVTAALNEAARQLSQTETLEQAVAALEGAQLALSKLGDPAASNLAENLKAFSEDLQDHPNADLRDLATASEQGNLNAAADNLKNLAQSLNELENQAEVAASLEGLSGALTGGDPDLTAAMAEAGDALRSGETDTAEAALLTAAERISALADTQTRNDTVDQLNNLVGASQERLLENAGELAASLEAQDGSTTMSTSGPNSVTGDGSGSEAGLGSSENSDAPGGQVGQNPIKAQNQPGDGGEIPFSSLFVPETLGGETATGVLLPSQGPSGDQILGQAPEDSQLVEGSSVPYQEVFPSYEAEARQAIETGRVPKHLLGLVRSYFISLEP